MFSVPAVPLFLTFTKKIHVKCTSLADPTPRILECLRRYRGKHYSFLQELLSDNLNLFRTGTVISTNGSSWLSCSLDACIIVQFLFPLMPFFTVLLNNILLMLDGLCRHARIWALALCAHGRWRWKRSFGF